MGMSAAEIAKKLTLRQREVMEKIHDRIALDGSDFPSFFALKGRQIAEHDRYRGGHCLTGLGMEVWLELPNTPLPAPRPKPKHERNAKGLALAWKEGRTMNLVHLRTDGSTVWSYNLIIGITDPLRQKIVYNYTRSADNFVSVTTSSHVGALMRYADKTLAPPAPKDPKPQKPRTVGGKKKRGKS